MSAKDWPLEELRQAYALAKDRNEGKEPDDLHVEYEHELAQLRYRVVKLEGAFEMASNSRCLWRRRALEAEAQLKENGK